MSTPSIPDQLRNVREWAKDKLAGESEPPWAWYQYMKLVETTDAILKSMEVKTTLEDLQESDLPEDTASIRLAVDNDPQGNSQHRSKPIPVQLPM